MTNNVYSSELHRVLLLSSTECCSCTAQTSCIRRVIPRQQRCLRSRRKKRNALPKWIHCGLAHPINHDIHLSQTQTDCCESDHTTAQTQKVFFLAFR